MSLTAAAVVFVVGFAGLAMVIRHLVRADDARELGVLSLDVRYENGAGQASVQPLLSAEGVIEVDGKAVDVHISERAARQHWSLSVPLSSARGVALELDPARIDGTDARVRSADVDRALAALALRHLTVVRLAVSGDALHLHGDSVRSTRGDARTFGDHVRTVARRLVALARALDETLPTSGLEARMCPRCGDVPLARAVGPRGDDRCPHCGVHFLSSELAARLMDEIHVDAHALKEATLSGRVEMRCAACHTKMAPVVVEHTIVELCRGCGALVLDEGELSSLSGA